MAETAKKRSSTTPSAAETTDADVFELPQAGGDAEVVRLPDPVAAEDDAWATEPDRPGGDVARTLRHAREARGVSLAEAAAETCITSSYLAALENDEPVSTFPAPAYARFFVREYAQYLGLDGDEIVDRYVEHHGIVDEAQLTDVPRLMMPSGSGASFRVLGAISALVLILLAAFWISRSSSRETPMMPVPAPGTTRAGGEGSANEGPGEARDVGSDNAPERARNVRIQVRVLERSWIRALADGDEVLFSGILDAGATQVLRADRRLDLRLGNVPGVRLFVDGQSIRTGGGSPQDLSFALRRGEVVEVQPVA
jgi:cytoskeleton protein RodZ